MKKITIVMFLMMFVILAGTLPAGAQSVQRIIYMEEYEPIYSVDIDNTIWDIEIDDGDIIGVSEDGMMWFFMGDVKDTEDLKLASDKISIEINKAFTNIKIVGTLDNFTVNGLPAYSYEATAKANGKDVIFFLTLFQVETDDIGILLFVMDPLAAELHRKRIMKMTTSVARR